MTTAKDQAQPAVAANPLGQTSAYDQWIASTGIPIHRGYYVEDLRTLELGPWPERGCDAAFLVLAGQEGITEARVTEIPPTVTLPPQKFALDEIIYVVEGRGLTTVWAEGGSTKRTFEWQKNSMFMVPRNYMHQLGNTQGSERVRLLHYNYLPLSMAIVPDPDFFFNNPYVDRITLQGDDGDLYSEATVIRPGEPGADAGGRVLWYGRFFPDMGVWDKLHTYQERGAGGHRVGIQFAKSTMWSHMSVFPSRTYKKGHRHGPGVLIVIPKGEGYSIMWPEGRERVVIPWHEASVFVPPDRWFHQHFNVGEAPARYLAFHAPRAVRPGERIENLARDQIEYSDEDPSIRQRFESELAARNLESLMPEQAYKDRDFAWGYDEGE